MRTAFTFEDDKELVQQARSFLSDGSRISWQDIAHRMRHTGHTSSALQKRLGALKRTWGRDISRFPSSFFTPVVRPRGRPQAIIRQIRALTRPRTQSPEIIDLVSSPSEDTQLSRAPTESPVAATDALAAMEVSRPGNDDAISSPNHDTLLAREPVESLAGVPGDSAAKVDSRPSPVPRSKVVGAVTSIFLDVPRELVIQDHKESHRNVGELMPIGINELLEELGPIDEHDIFLDIGAGVGNIVAHVALATTASMIIGIELRDDIHRVGVQMMARSSYAHRFRDRMIMVCKNVADIRLSYTPPYAFATIVCWNNILFEPKVVEYVKDQLCGMASVRTLVTTMKICARHRKNCRNDFCTFFQLMKELVIPCSWKADLQSVFVYKAIDFD